MELLPLLLIFAVMMLPLLFMSNRQKKAQQKQLELVRQLGVGDEVRTHSGFFGLIVEAYDDVVVLESEDGTQTKWARQAIAQAVTPVEDEAEEPSEVEDQAEGEVPGVTAKDSDQDAFRDDFGRNDTVGDEDSRRDLR